MDALVQYYTRLSEREQRMVRLGSIAAVVLLVLAVLVPLQKHVSALQERIEQKRDDLIWLRSMAPQLAGLAASAPPSTNEPLVVIVDRTARQAGLQRALINSQSSADGGLSIRLEQTSFDGLITWLAQLRDSYGVRVDSATVEPGNAAGLVNASLVLRSH